MHACLHAGTRTLRPSQPASGATSISTRGQWSGHRASLRLWLFTDPLPSRYLSPHSLRVAITAAQIAVKQQGEAMFAQQVRLHAMRSFTFSSPRLTGLPTFSPAPGNRSARSFLPGPTWARCSGSTSSNQI